MYVDLDDEKARWWFSSRMSLAILVSMGFMMMSSQKVSMELAIACMLNESTTNATIYRYIMPRPEDAVTLTPTAMTTVAMTSEMPQTTQNMTSSDNMTFPPWYFPAKPEAPRPCGEVLGLFTTNYSIHHFKEGELDWSQEKVDMVMSTYYWGYFLSQFPSGWLAERYGSRLVFGILMTAGSVSMLLLPVVAHAHYFILLSCRFLGGVGAGVALPATHALWGRWAVPHERSQLISISYSGIMLGHVVTFPLVSFLCRAGIVGGWPLVFYILGGAGVLWSVLWLVASQDYPLTHPRIAKQEKRYLLLSLNGQTTFIPKQPVGVPWLQVMTSLPILSVIACTAASDWLVHTLNKTIPDYMRHTRIFDIRDDPVVEGMPFAGLWLVVLVSGWCADRMQARGALNTAHTRKVMQILGTLGPCATVLAFGFLRCNHVIHAVVMLICAYAFTGFAYSGFLTNHLDLAPRYAGITLGLANTLGMIAQQAAPVLTKSIITDGTSEQWQTTMFIAASLYLLATILFVVCGSGDLEQWAIIDEPLPEIPERQNQPTTDQPKRAASVRRSPSKRGEEDLANHKRGLSLKTPGKRPRDIDWDYQKRPDSSYTMEYLNVPKSPDNVVSGTNDRRKPSDSGESNMSKRRSGSNHGPHSQSVTPTTPPITVAVAGSDNNEFFDTVPSL